MVRVDPNYGAHFGLSLEIGPAGNDQRVVEAWSALWVCASPHIDGPWEESECIGDAQRVLSGEQRDRPVHRRYGVLTLGDPFPALPFGFYWIREDKKAAEEPADWLTLGIPITALQMLPSFDGSWSIATQPWLATVCRALAEIADHIYSHAHLVVGVMGEEVSGCWRRPTPRRTRRAHQSYPPLAVLTSEVLEDRGGIVVAADLWQQLAPGITPVTLPSGLFYAPPRPSAALTGA
jgi:hypothetical protein